MISTNKDLILNTNESEKTEEWFKHTVRYYNLAPTHCFVHPDYKRKLDNYAVGLQSVDWIYSAVYRGLEKTKNNGSERTDEIKKEVQRYYTRNPEPRKLFDKITSVLMGEFSESLPKFSVEAIDELSRNEKNKIEQYLRKRQDHQALINAMAEYAGIVPPIANYKISYQYSENGKTKTKEVDPVHFFNQLNIDVNDPEQLSIASQMGFKSMLELVYETILTDLEARNGHEEKVESILENFIRYPICAIQLYQNLNTHLPDWEIVPVDELLLQDSTRKDYADSSFRGRYKRMSYYECVAKFNLSEKEKQDLFITHVFENKEIWGRYFRHDTISNTFIPHNPNFRMVDVEHKDLSMVSVYVLFAEILTNNKNSIVKNSETGFQRVLSPGSEPIQDNEEIVSETYEQTIYQGYYLGKTDIVADFRPSTLRDNEGKPMFSIIVLRTKDLSPLEKVIPDLDDNDLIYFMESNEIAKAEQSGKQYNLTSLENAANILDVDVEIMLTHARHTNEWAVAPIDSDGLPNNNTASHQDLPGGLKEGFFNFQLARDNIEKSIRKQLGISDGRDVATPDTTVVYLQKLQQEASIKSTRYLFEASKRLLADVYHYYIRMIHQIAKNPETYAYSKLQEILGEALLPLSAIEAASNTSMPKLKFEPKITVEKQQMLFQLIAEQRNKGALTPVQAYIAVSNDDIKHTVLYLTILEQRKINEENKRMAALQQQKQQGEQQLSQQEFQQDYQLMDGEQTHITQRILTQENIKQQNENARDFKKATDQLAKSDRTTQNRIREKQAEAIIDDQ